MSASPYILATEQPVAALGGFSGGDPILTTEQLAAMIERGEVRYFLVPSTAQLEDMGKEFAAMAGTQPPANDTGTNSDASSSAAPNAGPWGQSENTAWINAHCTPVPAAEWQSAQADESEGPMGMNSLFDCAAA
jgi:hypothetical protein